MELGGGVYESIERNEQLNSLEPCIHWGCLVRVLYPGYHISALCD